MPNLTLAEIEQQLRLLSLDDLAEQLRLERQWLTARANAIARRLVAAELLGSDPETARRVRVVLKEQA